MILKILLFCKWNLIKLLFSFQFTPDFQNLISVGGDSCIIVWSLSREMVVTMETRMSEKRSRKKSITPVHNTPTPVTPTPTPNPPSPVRADYRLVYDLVCFYYCCYICIYKFGSIVSCLI